MLFKDTNRASPVIYEGRKSWEYDLMHYAIESIPESPVQFREFMQDNNIVTDKEWWGEEFRRCNEGIYIPDAIEKGGDAYIDEKHCFWNDDLKEDRYLEKYDYTIPPNSVYIPQYDLLIKDKTVHITGKHYFYLNYWKIFRKVDNEKRKDVLHPKFLDIDFFFFRRIEMMYEQEKDGIEQKSRQKGYSEKLAAILGWNFTFMRSSLNIVAGGMSDDSDHTMENVQRGLRALINTQFYKERNKSKSDYWRARYFGSELRSISLKDNSQGISRFTPTFIVFEEVGKFKAGLIKEAREYVDVSLQAENVKTGYSLFIATGGDMELGAQDMQDFYYDPDSVNCLAFENEWDREQNITSRTGHFTPADLFKIIDDQGNSFRQQGHDAVMSERKKKKPKDRYTHTTQQALFASDSFLIATGGYFGEEVAQWCNERLSFLQTHQSEQLVETGWLRWKDNSNMHKGVFFEPDPEGPFRILEHPMLDQKMKPYSNLYVTATDSYDQDESYTTTSEGACWVKKRFLNSDTTYNLYVAGILERPETAIGGRDLFYEHTALLTMYYNSQNLIEWSKILIFDWYTRNGLTHLLKERPEFILSKMINNSQATNFYGVDPSTKPYWLALLAKDLRQKENIEKCYFPELLKAWAKFKYMPGKLRYNCDLTIATSLCSTFEADIIEMAVISEGELVDDDHMPVYSNDNGMITQIW